MHGISDPVFEIVDIEPHEICKNDKDDRGTFGGMIKLIMDVPALEAPAGTISGVTIEVVIRWNIPSRRVQALDELLDFPHLNVLFCDVLTHAGRALLGSLPFFGDFLCLLQTPSSQAGKEMRKRGRN
jgi:hypothetical protein